MHIVYIYICNVYIYRYVHIVYTKMPNIIWSPTMWFWAPCMIDAELVEQGFGKKTASTKFPLIPFPPNSFFSA